MRIIVSTDSSKYAEIANQYGAETPFLRPDEISGDLSTDYECIKHCINWLYNNENYNPDIILHLRPTQPCRKVKDIIIVEEDYINWVWLSVINIFLALGWLLSLIHYTPAVELGGRELFAFHLSSSVFAFNKLKYTMAERNE